MSPTIHSSPAYYPERYHLTVLQEAERIARERGRTLPTLDTGTDDGGGPLYEKLGFVRAGVIPDCALKPHGGLQGTIIYWKRIGAAPESTQR